MLGKFISKQRAGLGLTQAELTAKLGVSRPTYKKIETGGREPTLSEAEKLAEEFGMTLADLQAQKAPRRARRGTGPEAGNSLAARPKAKY